ncbi:MAG: class I SAM-dependent methyltransferase [Solirubrobacterales bacterium]
MSAAAVIWHDVECGSYDADLRLWEELAEGCDGPVLDLGCGTGRVALHLARRGHRVIGVDRDHELTPELAERAGDLPVETICADALDFELAEPVGLALAPMQFLQLLGSAESRIRCLRRVAAALRPGGLLAAALVERAPPVEGTLPPLPDVREVDGWVYSSLPTDVVGVADGRIILRRLRQTVAPDGGLSEEADEIQLLSLTAGELEAEGKAAGFASAGRRSIPATEAHVGSSVVLLERSD